MADGLAHARLGYLTGLRAALEGDLGPAGADLEHAAMVASREGDEELAALARLALGRVRIFLGQVKSGVRLLDEAMFVVGSEPICPMAVGDSYCTAIDACHDLFDVRRGQAWTDRAVPLVRAAARPAAAYQQGELHRLLGEFDKAEACYRAPARLVATPCPGWL